MGKFKKSFYDGCIENGQNEFIDLWDDELNKYTPKDIGYFSNKKYFHLKKTMIKYFCKKSYMYPYCKGDLINGKDLSRQNKRCL